MTCVSLRTTPAGFLELLDILSHSHESDFLLWFLSYFWLDRAAWIIPPLFHSLAFPELHFALERGKKSQLIFFLRLTMGMTFSVIHFMPLFSNLWSLACFFHLRLNHHFYIRYNTVPGGMCERLRNSWIGRKVKFTFDKWVYAKWCKAINEKWNRVVAPNSQGRRWFNFSSKILWALIEISLLRM